MDSTKRRWIYAGLVLVAGVGLVTAVQASVQAEGPPEPPAPPGPPPAPVPERPAQLGRGLLRSGARVLLVGDSLAQGLSVSMAKLAKDASVPFLGHGIVSTRINQWCCQPWLAADVLAAKPTLVLVSLGTNDAALADPTVERAQLQKLLAALVATGAKVVWIAPPKVKLPSESVVREMIRATGLDVFPSDALAIPRGPDGLHPTAAGYAGWAGAIWRWLA